jgi:hypothetical protein
MLLRVKIVGVHSAVLLGHDRGAGDAAPRVLCRDWSRGRGPFRGTARRQRSVTVTMALREEPESSRSGFAGPNWDPGLEIEVPFEQRPVTGTAYLRSSFVLR